MDIINLGNKRIAEVNINGRECVVSLAIKNIQHFQENNKMSLQKALEEMKNDNLEVILNLIYSLVSDKKSKRVLGRKFFDQFDEFQLLEALTPVLNQLLSTEMPQAKNNNEKNE